MQRHPATGPPLHCTKQGSLEHKAWPGPCWQVVLPDWKHLLPVAMHLHGIGRAPTATLLHMRWVSMHLHRYRGGGGLACRIGFVSTSMSVWHAWYLQGGIDLFRLFVEIGRPFKKNNILLATSLLHIYCSVPVEVSSAACCMFGCKLVAFRNIFCISCQPQLQTLLSHTLFRFRSVNSPVHQAWA